MNAQQMENLVREVLARALDDTREQTMVRAGAALDELQAGVNEWAVAAVKKAQEAERLAEAKRILEAAEAELIMAETHPEGRINGSSEDKRKQQIRVLLAKEGANGGLYGQASHAFQSAQAAADQAGLEEHIAAEELAAIKIRCRLIEAQLLVLGAE